MSKPTRIQRQRTKGWRMPPNTVYVGRPTKWGNPFSSPFFLGYFDKAQAIRLFLNIARGGWTPMPELSATLHAMVYGERNAWVRRFGGSHPDEVMRGELRGKDLACWCPLDQPCHADVLLELANAEVSR